jgi:hypothetical protein
MAICKAIEVNLGTHLVSSGTSYMCRFLSEEKLLVTLR